MKINFTKQEYRILVTLLEIADWVISAHDTELHPAKQPYQTLRKKILSYFKEMGMEDCYTYNKEHDDYYKTNQYESSLKSMQFIENYNEIFFWEELIAKLAERDFRQKYGDQKVDLGTHVAEFKRFEAHYYGEIMQNGLLNLAIAKTEKPILH